MSKAKARKNIKKMLKKEFKRAWDMAWISLGVGLIIFVLAHAKIDVDDRQSNEKEFTSAVQSNR